MGWTDNQWGLVIIPPMIVATAVVLWRQGALSLKTVVLIAVVVLGIAGSLFRMLM